MRRLRVTLAARELLDAELGLGWTWRGIEHTGPKLTAADLDSSGSLDVLVPATGATLWWKWRLGTEFVREERAIADGATALEIR